MKIDRLKAQLKTKFEIKDLEKTKKIIGMEIQGDRRKVTLSLTQTRYSKKILRGNTPFALLLKLSALLSSRTKDKLKHMNQIPYANAVDALI